MKNLTTLILLIFTSTNLFTESIPPKREYRTVWIAIVTNFDWPSSRTLSTANQKLELTKLLDSLKLYGVNTVIFQIRTECDSFYNFFIEPSSYYLANSQGTSPSPFYDPVQFAVEEAQKRGMEFARFNPYRVDRNIGSYTKHPIHVTNTHPDWILTFPIQDFDIHILINEPCVNL